MFQEKKQKLEVGGKGGASLLIVTNDTADRQLSIFLQKNLNGLACVYCCGVDSEIFANCF